MGREYAVDRGGHDAGAKRRRMRDDVRAGLLLAAQKELPPTYFYDATGSALFEQITELPEYYLTRAERRLLERHAGDIVARAHARALAELGSGTSEKSRILLAALCAAGGRTYVPIDVDGDTVFAAAAALRSEFPGLDVQPLIADLRDQVCAPWPTERPLLYAFLGSTIGNFDPREARTLLARIRAGLGAGDSLLLGLDLIKDVATIEAAYNDSRGVTAEFNRNALRVLNAELGATFDVEAFDHLAFYSVEQRRIEMHLVARCDHHVLIPGVGVVRFKAGETIRTEISCKYDRQSAEQLLTGAGWRVDQWLTDADGAFALAVARPATSAGTAPGMRGRSEVRVRRALFHEHVAQRAFAGPRRARERVGAEIEFIAVGEADGRVALLDAPHSASILGAVREAARRRDWREGQSGKGAPWFALPSGGRVTFEPGGQVEYAAPPRASVSALLDDLVATAAALRSACRAAGIVLLDCGIDPVNGPSSAPLQVEALRYRRMNAHFSAIGPAGARMMRQTAGLHVSVDLGADVGGRWRLLNALAPILTATFANSRRYAGEDTGYASFRAQTWREVDPSRTGILVGRDPVGEYVDLATNAAAFLLGPEDAPAQPFGAWLDAGAGVADWEEHLGTLFPEVRPRGYFEVRSIDAVPETRWPAALALVGGLVYDPRAAHEALEVLGYPDGTLLERAARAGLGDPILRSAAGALTEIALGGCRRLGPSFVAAHHLAAAEEVLGDLTR